METTVTLQDPFEYSWWVLVVGAVCLLLGIILLIISLRKIIKLLKKKKEEQSVEPPKLVSNLITRTIGERYIKKIDALKKNYQKGKITKRDGYQELSLIIRGFVHECTGKDVEKCTLKDLKEMKVYWLANLIEDYYIPEFAEDSRAEQKDFVQSCDNAMGVIRSWI